MAGVHATACSSPSRADGERDGGLLLSEVVVPDNPLRWTSTLRQPGDDGLRDRHRRRAQRTRARRARAVSEVHRRGTAQHGPPRPAHRRCGRSTCSTRPRPSNEALALMDGIQLVMVGAHGFDATLHLAIEDADGDSAIIEFAAGKPVVHHGREFTLMTNDPTYDEQLQLLAAQGLLASEPRGAVARQRQRRRPIPARRVLLGAAARTQRPTPGGGRRDGHHAQRVGAVRRAVR